MLENRERLPGFKTIITIVDLKLQIWTQGLEIKKGFISEIAE